MTTVQIPTSELVGKALDYAAAISQGGEYKPFQFATEQERINYLKARVIAKLDRLARNGVAYRGVSIIGRKVTCDWREANVGSTANPATIARVMALSTGQCPSGSTFDGAGFALNLRLLGYAFVKGRIERY